MNEQANEQVSLIGLVGRHVRVRWGGRYWVDGQPRERHAEGVIIKTTKHGKLRIRRDNADQCSRKEINARLLDIVAGSVR